MAKKRDKVKLDNNKPKMVKEDVKIEPIYKDIDKEIKITISKNNSIFVEYKDKIREDTVIKFKDNKMVIGDKEIEINKDIIINVR